MVQDWSCICIKRHAQNLKIKVYPVILLVIQPKTLQLRGSNSLPRTIIHSKHSSGRNGMEGTSKYAMLHAMARNERSCCIILCFGRTAYANTELSIFSSAKTALPSLDTRIEDR